MSWFQNAATRIANEVRPAAVSQQRSQPIFGTNHNIVLSPPKFATLVVLLFFGGKAASVRTCSSYSFSRFITYSILVICILVFLLLLLAYQNQIKQNLGGMTQQTSSPPKNITHTHSVLKC
jgi:hypothetical protein